MDSDREELLNELAKLFREKSEVDRLLGKARVPTESVPALGTQTPASYWQSVFQKLDGGLVDGFTVNSLAATAGQLYPGNETFKKYRTPTAVVTPQDRIGIRLVVVRMIDSVALRDFAVSQADLLGVPGTIRLRVFASTCICLELSE